MCIFASSQNEYPRSVEVPLDAVCSIFLVFTLEL